jgi:hypothetical protein
MRIASALEVLLPLARPSSGRITAWQTARMMMIAASRLELNMRMRLLQKVSPHYTEPPVHKIGKWKHFLHPQ